MTKINYSLPGFCIMQEHAASSPCSLDHGDCLACFVLFHHSNFHRWFHTIPEASGSPLYCQSFCVLERRYAAYFSRICSAIIPSNSTVTGDRGRNLQIHCATRLACRSLSFCEWHTCMYHTSSLQWQPVMFTCHQHNAFAQDHFWYCPFTSPLPLKRPLILYFSQILYVFCWWINSQSVRVPAQHAALRFRFNSSHADPFLATAGFLVGASS